MSLLLPVSGVSWLPPYIAIEATERNMAGLAAIARLISPEVEDRVRQLSRLMEETRTRQAGPATVR